MLVAEALMLTAGVTAGVITMVMLLLLAIAGLAHAALDVTSSVITSPFARVVVVYDEEVAPPIGEPFFFHTYAGVPPPFVTLELKVTEVPPQTLLAEDVMVTDGVTDVLIVIVRALDVTFVVEAHNALLVISQVITSLFANTVVVKVGELVPTLLPFFFHW